MEHRYHPRVKAALPVSLSHHGQHLGVFPTRDLSLGGLFVRSGPLDLRRNAPISVELLLEGPDPTVEGCVAHGDDDGIGVMLEQPGPRYATAMLGLMGPRSDLLPGAHANHHAAPADPAPAADSHAGGEEHTGEMVIQAAERFDLVACRQFVRAARLVENDEVERVVVDLTATREVLDSGLALLRMLYERTDGDPQRVVLANCHPSIARRLREAGMEPA